MTEIKSSILLRYKGIAYNFLTVFFSLKDHSYYVVVNRKGNAEKPQTLNDSHEWVPSQIQSKTKRISYHPTGYVKCHNLTGLPIIGDPLFALKRELEILIMSIPSIKSLDQATDDISDSVVIDIDDEGRLEFSLTVAPFEHSLNPEGLLCEIKYKDLLSFLVKVKKLDHDVADKRFFYFFPRQGLYEKQLVPEEDALIRMHQILEARTGMILYPPNNEGVWRLIFSVPKRAKPNATILFENSHFKMCEEVFKNLKDTAELRFSVKDQHGNKIKKIVGIKGIELDSEL